MRTSHKTELLKNSNNEFCGFFLEADFVAEHERGISGISRLLNCFHENKMGIERRTCQNPIANNISLFQNKNKWCLLVTREYNHSYLKDTKNTHTHSKWDSDSFMVVSDSLKELELLQKEMVNNNVAVFIGGNSGNPFSKGGLTVVIVDRLDKEHKDKMLAGDKDTAKLKAAADATGIKQKIDKINEYYYSTQIGYEPPCGYFALSPRWINKSLVGQSKYSVMFWLNPQEQQKNNYGWFTVEDLEDWIHQKGKVVK